MMRRKVLVIGLDGAPASLVFGEAENDLPEVHRLAKSGSFGVLRSCDPPITVPAWACLMSGKDPGELGLYGFRRRYGPGYADQELVHSGLLPKEMLWDWVAEQGGRTILVGVPPAYPPPVLHGIAVSCLLTPGGGRPLCYPGSAAALLDEVAPDYRCDISDFRSAGDAEVMEQSVAGLRARFRLARELARREEWDLFVLTEIGVDRVQHGFWGGSRGKDEAGRQVREYYRWVDEEIGLWLAELPDDVCVWIVSDHGAQASFGGVFLNEWLRQQGWLKLLADNVPPQAFTPSLVDWDSTRAWADGGYVGRIYLNVRGRQPAGIVDRADVDRVCQDLRDALTSELARSGGRRAPVFAFRPEEVYRDCRGYPPDLLVYVGGLRWRVFGGVGSPTLWSDRNDFGRDRANHHHDGLFIAYDPRSARRGYAGVLSIDSLRPFLERQLLGEAVCFPEG